MKCSFSLVLFLILLHGIGLSQNSKTLVLQPGPLEGVDTYINSAESFQFVPNGNCPDLISSAYTYTYDQVVLLPTISIVLCQLINVKDKKPIWIYIGLMLTVNLLDLFLHRNLDDFWFGWLAPAYLICYLIGNWLAGRKQKPVPG